MSLFANTLQRPAIRGGSTDRRAISPNSFSIATPILLACWSRNEPVPAAQMLFISKSTSPVRPVEVSFSRIMSFESSPPISITLFASGYSSHDEVAWAMISFTKTPPRSSVASFPPVPVIAIPATEMPGYS